MIRVWLEKKCRKLIFSGYISGLPLIENLMSPQKSLLRVLHNLHINYMDEETNHLPSWVYSHRSDIDTHCKQLIDVLLRAGYETLPQCKSNATDFGSPLWNDEIDDIREVALFWHWLWIDNGRPRLGHVADIIRRTRAKYPYTVRYTKRCENDRRKRKMAESVSTNNQRDL